MRRLPRLALATPWEGPDPSFAGMALLAGLAALGWRVQHFRSQARPLGATIVGQVTGLPERHLDSWLMPPEVCREVFVRGSRQADLALVEGTLTPPGRVARTPTLIEQPGWIGPIRDALDLPTIAVVPCRGLGDFHLPHLAPNVDGLLLDGLERAEDFEGLRRVVPLLAHRPVVGAVLAHPAARVLWRGGVGDRPLPTDLIARLGQDFLGLADLAALRSLAESRPWSFAAGEVIPESARPFRVAYAHDEAFGGFYPDTLETLEALGADLVEFSPLRSESLPAGADLVMIGCGYPDRHADELAANFSLIASLKSHVCKGRRLYTEGGGAAYLGRYLVLGDRRVPAAGILPFDAVLLDRPHAAAPVSRTLVRESWLGAVGTPVRGYRCTRWELRPAPDPGDCPARSGVLTAERDLYFRHHAIGSLIHLHLASLPEVVAAFAGPHSPSLRLPSRQRSQS